MYISKQVYSTILKPTFEKERYIDNIICHNSWRNKIQLCHDQLKVIRHTCTTNDTVIYIIVVKDPACLSLNPFSLKKDNRKYYGIQNNSITSYPAAYTKFITLFK